MWCLIIVVQYQGIFHINFTWSAEFTLKVVFLKWVVTNTGKGKHDIETLIHRSEKNLFR